MRRFQRGLAAAFVLAGLAVAGPAEAQWAVNDAQLNGTALQLNQQAGQTNSQLGQANAKLDEAVRLLGQIGNQMVETARNTASTLDQAQRTAASIGDPREKASRREVRQKWIVGGQGYARVASPADAVRPVGTSWGLRLNQPRGDGSDVRPSIDVLADPGLAARYSRQAYSVNGVDPSQTARARLEARRRSELASATHDAHGMALYSVLATSATYKRADRLLTIADEAYEGGVSDQLFALNMAIVAMVEEQAALRGLIAQNVRMAAAAQMAATPAFGSSPPQLSAGGGNDDMVYEFGADGQATTTTDPGASAGNLTGVSGASLPRTTSARSGGPGSWSFMDGLDYATQPGDYMSSIGGMGGVGCPYSTMMGSRGSGCLQSVARLLLGDMGGTQGGRTILAVVSGGLSARSLGYQSTVLDMRTVANMFGLGGMMSCFGGNPSTCNYACQRLATERMPGGRCEYTDDSRNSGYCWSLERSCQGEGQNFGLSPNLSTFLSGLTGIGQ